MPEPFIPPEPVPNCPDCTRGEHGTIEVGTRNTCACCRWPTTVEEPPLGMMTIEVVLFSDRDVDGVLRSLSHDERVVSVNRIDV